MSILWGGRKIIIIFGCGQLKYISTGSIMVIFSEEYFFQSRRSGYL